MHTSHSSDHQDDRYTISISTSTQTLPLSLRQLLQPEYAQGVKEYFERERRIDVHNLERLLVAPEECVQAFLSILVQCNNERRFMVQGGERVFVDPFDAILNTTFDKSELSVVGRAAKCAVMFAATYCSGTFQEAATRIHSWLARNGIQSEPIRSIAAEIRRLLPSEEDSESVRPQDLANMVLRHLQQERSRQGENNITTPPVRYFQGDFSIYRKGLWHKIADFRCEIVRILQTLQIRSSLTDTIVNSVMTNLQAMTGLDCQDVRPPFLVTDGHETRVQHQEALSLENGIIIPSENVPNTSQHTLLAHTASLFAAPYLGYAYNAHATCELWIRTLEQVLPRRSNDDRRVEVLQEFVGYCLLVSNCTFETFLILTGNGSNGKSVILAVLCAMLGKHNVSHVPLDYFGAEFRNSEMKGKLANVATDLQRIARVHEGSLKQMTSGEPIQVNRKYKDPESMYPTAKLVFATNHLPSFADTSNGLWRRMLVIPFLVQFSGDQVDRLRSQRIIQGELAGVLNWALAGARRLLAQNGFTDCRVCEEAKREHRQDSDPFLQFLDECCEVRASLSVPAKSLYTAYTRFCEDSRRMPKSHSEFGKQLKSKGFVKERSSQSRQRTYVYRGIGLLLIVPDAMPEGYMTSRRRSSRDLRDFGGGEV